MTHRHFWLGTVAALVVFGTAGCDQVATLRPLPESPRAASAPAAPAAAVPRAQAPAAPAGSPLSVREVAERVKPAVVQIVTEQGAGRTDVFGNGRGRRSGVGSGVVYDAAGRILTNNHVVAGGRSLAVAFPDGRTFDAKLVGADPETDLAVIQVTGDNLPMAPLGDSDRLAVGDGVVAIGNALGLPGGPTVTSGVVSALGRTVQEPGEGNESGAVLFDVIQTDAAINPGNSGGPLVNMYGEVIGINTMVAGMTQAGIPVQGIGFAVAVNTAKPIADQLVATGRATHPFLGITFQWAGGASTRQRGSAGQQGVLVQQVSNGSPAARAGLERGDLITKVNGQPLNEEAALLKAIRKSRPGDTLDLTVVRENKERVVKATLGERPRS
jgi:S1-C subfamily serine protease